MMSAMTNINVARLLGWMILAYHKKIGIVINAMSTLKIVWQNVVLARLLTIMMILIDLTIIVRNCTNISKFQEIFPTSRRQ